MWIFINRFFKALATFLPTPRINRQNFLKRKFLHVLIKYAQELGTWKARKVTWANFYLFRLNANEGSIAFELYHGENIYTYKLVAIYIGKRTCTYKYI